MVSIYIALYLFLAGTGAGAFLIGAVVDMVLRFRPRAAGGWFARVSAVTDAGLILGACGGERAFSFSRLGCARSGVSPLSCFDLQSSFHGCVGYSGILRDGDARIGPGVTC